MTLTLALRRRGTPRRHAHKPPTAPRTQAAHRRRLLRHGAAGAAAASLLFPAAGPASVTHDPDAPSQVVSYRDCGQFGVTGSVMFWEAWSAPVHEQSTAAGRNAYSGPSGWPNGSCAGRMSVYAAAVDASTHTGGARLTRFTWYHTVPAGRSVPRPPGRTRCEVEVFVPSEHADATVHYHVREHLPGTRDLDGRWRWSAPSSVDQHARKGWVSLGTFEPVVEVYTDFRGKQVLDRYVRVEMLAADYARTPSQRGAAHTEAGASSMRFTCA